jgi:hypothetical protein
MLNHVTDLIESLTGFDFLTNLPNDVENRIEANRDFQRNNTSLSASLLANSTSFDPNLISPVFHPFLKSSIRHDGVSKHDEMNIAQNTEFSPSEVGFSEIGAFDSGGKEISSHQFSTSEIDIKEIGSGQVSTLQISPLHNSTFEIGSGEVSIDQFDPDSPSTDGSGFSQISPTQVSTNQVSTNQDSFNQIGIPQNGVHQVGFSQISPTQIGSTQVSPTQTGITQVSPTQVSADQLGISQFDSSQLSINQINPTEIDTSKIPLTSSISSEQLLSSHNPTSYNFDNSASLLATDNEIIHPSSVEYNPTTHTATLHFNGFEASEYQLIIDDNLQNPDGITLKAPYQVDFTAVSDFSELVDLEFTNTRSDRTNETISFDVSLTNQTDYDLSLPLNLVLQPGNNSETAQPTEYTSINDTGAYWIDLSDTLPDGILKPGESITEQTVTIYNPDDLRFEYEPGIYTLPTTNQAPVFTSEPVTTATAGESYVYSDLAPHQTKIKTLLI